MSQLLDIAPAKESDAPDGGHEGQVPVLGEPPHHVHGKAEDSRGVDGAHQVIGRVGIGFGRHSWNLEFCPPAELHRLGLSLDAGAIAATPRVRSFASQKCATMVSLDSQRESLFDRAYRFARAVIVGSGATLVDFLVLTSCIRVVGVAPVTARLPALIAGATFQFFGNRTFTFRARAGSISRQARLFVAAELVALLCNFLIYRWLVPRITFLPPEATSFVGTFIVFITFGYPMRRLVIFRLPEPELPEAGLAAQPVVERTREALSAREQAGLQPEKFGKPR